MNFEKFKSLVCLINDTINKDIYNYDIFGQIKFGEIEFEEIDNVMTVRIEVLVRETNEFLGYIEPIAGSNNLYCFMYENEEKSIMGDYLPEKCCDADLVINRALKIIDCFVEISEDFQ